MNKIKKLISTIILFAIMFGLVSTVIAPTVFAAGAEFEYIIKPQYDYISCFNEGLAAINVGGQPTFDGVYGGKWGIVDKTGKIIVKPQFDGVKNYYYRDIFHEGLVAVKVNDKWGFIDKTGKFVVKPQFDEVGDFNEGLASVRVNGKYGYIDKTGKAIIKPQFDYAYNFNGGIAQVTVNNKFGLINKTGKIVIKPQYKYIGDFNEGLAAVVINDKLGYVDKSGKYVIKPQFSTSGYLFEAEFSGGLARVAVNEKYGYIDKTGKIVIKPNYDDALKFDGDFAVVGVGFFDYKYGIIDKTGKVLIKPQFDFLLYYSEGLFNVEVNGKWGFVDKTGKFIIKPQFDYADSFSGGLGKITLNGKIGLIDKTGKIVVKPQFDDLSDFSEDLARVGIGNKYGYIDKTGKVIIKPQFDYAGSFNDGVTWIKVNGKYGVIKNPLVKVSTISLSKTKYNLKIGGKDTLIATIKPTNATNKNVTWKSSNPSVVKVDSTGKITAVSIGSSTITVITSDGNKKATCKVTVTKNPLVKVSTISLSKTKYNLKIGGKDTLIATIKPTNATNKNVTWKSSNPSVVKVDSTGKITAVSIGSSTITVITSDGNKKAACKVTVTK